MTLSTLELSQLRVDCETYLPDTCAIQTVTRSSDGAGGWSEAWADASTAVECRLVPVKQATRIAGLPGGQVTEPSSRQLVLHHDQSVASTQRVVHSSDTYEITQMEDTHSQRGTKRVYLRRLD